MRPNNFDLIRLLAAAQVVYCHTCFHLDINTGVGDPLVAYFIHWFPGVPIFFAISGFLISRSWERSSHWQNYALKRILRIYPGLWVQLAVGILVAAAFGAITPAVATSPQFFAWVFAQASCVQFFNPAFLREFGLGVLNGSLWTIPVELGFYLSLPVLYSGMINRFSRRGADLGLGMISVASFAYWYYLSVHADPESLWTKLQMVSPLPHLFMFLVGILIQRNFDRLRTVLENHALAWFAAFAACMLILNPWGVASLSPFAPSVFVGRLLLAMTVFSFAFSYRNLSEDLLRGNDLSYGVYLYHGLAINVLVELNWKGSQTDLLLVTLFTGVLAALSWTLVERPAVSRKLHPSLNPVGAPSESEQLHVGSGSTLPGKRAA